MFLKKKYDKKQRNNFYGAICAIIVGISLSFAGFVLYLFGKPDVGLNYRGLTFVDDGSMGIVSGILLFSLGIYKLFFRKQIIGQIKELEEEALLEAEITKQKSKYPGRRNRKNRIKNKIKSKEFNKNNNNK